MMKLTKKIALEVALTAIEANPTKEYHFAGSEEVFTAEDVKAKLMTIIDSLNAKASAPKKPTANQTANEGLKGVIAEVLSTVGKPITITELMQADDRLSPMVVSAQKVSALVSQMVKAGTVIRTEEKRKAYFSLPSEG